MNGVTVSDVGQDEPSTASVFDFLYHDSRRIASFLSQFDENGLLTGLRQSEGVSIATKRGWKVGLGASAPLVGGGNVALERSPGDTGTMAAERSYDPLWANAREFLAALSERGLIERNVDSARIGQFVLVKGALVINDLGMLKQAWGSSVVRDFVTAHAQAEIKVPQQEELQNRSQRRTALAQQKTAKPAKKAPSEAELALALLPYLPHSNQLNIIGDNFAVWGAAAEEAMVGSMADLVLKHGPKVAGTWSMLGILDAKPYEQAEQLTPLEMIYTGMTVDTLSKVTLQMAPHIRQLLGRPLLAYGMTPLLVFREVEAGRHPDLE